MRKSNSGNEYNQQIVPTEVHSDNSESDNTKPNIKALPNNSIFSELMTKTSGSLLSGYNSLKIKSSLSGGTFLGVPINTLGGDKFRMRDQYY